MERCPHCASEKMAQVVGAVIYQCHTQQATGSRARPITRSWACYEIARLNELVKALKADYEKTHNIKLPE